MADMSLCGLFLDPSQAALWGKCASVQLREHDDRDVVSLAVRLPKSKKPLKPIVGCIKLTDAIKATYRANATETIEAGACAIAAHVAASHLNIIFACRAVEGDGFDFFFYEKGRTPSEFDLFDGTAVVEVSGINQESPTNTISARAKKKAMQARSRHSFPIAYAIVVEFATPQAMVVAA